MTKRIKLEYGQKTLNQELSNTIVAKINDKTNDEILKGYFNDYKCIGYGAFGEVFQILVKDKKNQTKLGLNEEMAAIKICPEFSFSSILQETKIISLGIHHPNIVEFKSCLHFCSDMLTAHRFDGNSKTQNKDDANDESELSKMKVGSSVISIGIVMELLPGVPLATLLSMLPGSKFSEKQAKSIFEQIGGALAYLHREHGIVHSDLHVGNMMTSQQIDLSNFKRETEIGLVKLIDFGLAQRCDKKTIEQYHNEPCDKLSEDCRFMQESKLFGIMISTFYGFGRTEFDSNNNSFEVSNLTFQSILSRLYATGLNRRLKLFEALELTKKL